MIDDPGGREPAPEPLRAVQAFVNTVDIEHGRDELTDPTALRDVLVRVGVLDADDGPLGARDLAAALAVREALRELTLANNGFELTRDATATLERAARAGHVTVHFDPAGKASLDAEAPGLDGALGQLVAIVFTAIADGSWARLKACRRDVCHWVYYDRSRNASSTWCAMSVCGNRTKTKRYRRRQAGV